MSEYKYTLIKSLYYSLRENNLPNSNSIRINNSYKFGTNFTNSSRSLNSSYEEGFQPLNGKLFNISYEGIRIPITNTTTSVIATFKEFVNINIPEGNLNGSSVYNDSSTGISTTINKTYWCISGSGIFIDANYMEIIYDNSGSISGYPRSRQLDIYKVEKI